MPTPHTHTHAETMPKPKPQARRSRCYRWHRLTADNWQIGRLVWQPSCDENNKPDVTLIPHLWL